MSEWISVDDEFPELGEMVIIFRPQVMTEDHTDKPIREATYKGSGKFSAWHQPTHWMSIQPPVGFTFEMLARQVK
jgi:hypothetical protein